MAGLDGGGKTDSGETERSRPLTSGERAIARAVFGDALDPALIELRGDKFAPFQPTGAVLAEARRVWFGPLLPRDFAAASVPMRALLVHELTHCAQARAGMDLWVRGVGAHLRAFVTRRSAYDYDRGPAPLLGRPFEHQAAMVEDAYRMVRGVPPRRAGATLPALLEALGHAPGHASGARASLSASLSLGAPPLLNTPLR